MTFFTQPRLEVLFDKDTIEKRVAALGAEITRHYASEVGVPSDRDPSLQSQLIVVGILKGSFVFLADLARHIDLPVQIEFMGCSSYGDATESSGAVQVTQDLTKPIAGRHVLVVEDIVDTGLTMRYLLDNLQSRGPASLKVASLLEKPEKNLAKIKVDFLGFSIADNFVVGYGLDAGGLYRNLPFVGLVLPATVPSSLSPGHS